MRKGTSNQPKRQMVRKLIALLVLISMVMGFIGPLMWALIAH